MNPKTEVIMFIFIAIRRDKRTGNEFPHLPSSSEGSPVSAEDAAGIFEDQYPGWGDRFPIIRIGKFECREVTG